MSQSEGLGAHSRSFHWEEMGTQIPLINPVSSLRWQQTQFRAGILLEILFSGRGNMDSPRPGWLPSIIPAGREVKGDFPVTLNLCHACL